jgi:hypothetical protein
MAGARRVQREILAKNPAANLHVYVVWFSMLPTDAKSRWNWTGGLLHDQRVTHFWDEQKLVGRWLAAQGYSENRDDEIIWDAFFLYGPDAKWDAKPEPLVRSGSTVVEEADELESALVPLLK